MTTASTSAGTVFQGLEREQHLYRPRSMVCYYGAHYQAFVLLPDAGGWALFDDASVSLVGDGTWRAVREKCRLGRIQPSVIFFEAATGGQRGSASRVSHAAMTAAPELQPRPHEAASRCQPLVPFPPQRPALVPSAVAARQHRWDDAGRLPAKGHSGGQLVVPPELTLSAAAPERSQSQHSLPADPSYLLLAHGKDVGEAHSRVPQLQQPWGHPQQPQQHASDAFGMSGPLVGNGHAAHTEPSAWTVPSREALEALLAAGPPAVGRGSSHLPAAFVSAALPSAVSTAWHAASLPASVKEHTGTGMAHQQRMLTVPQPDSVRRLLPPNGFSALHGGR